jgi:hypothetical protein
VACQETLENHMGAFLAPSVAFPASWAAFLVALEALIIIKILFKRGFTDLHPLWQLEEEHQAVELVGEQ